MFTKDDYILCLDTRTSDAKKGLIKDETPYGAPNQVRANQANILLASVLEESEALTFITGIDNSSPLTALSWYFDTAIDTEYRFFLMAFYFYDNAAVYGRQTFDTDSVTVLSYANIIYHPGSAKFYKAIYTGALTFSGIQPSVTAGWANYWVEFTSFSSEILNDKIIVHIHDDLVTFKYEDCLAEDLVDKTDAVLCGVCDNWDKLVDYFKARLLLAGAESENWQGHSARAGFIIKEATKKFCC